MHKDLKKIKPTMRIVNRKKVKDTPGIIQHQTVRPLCGTKQHPSERIRVGVAKFKPNIHEHLHWHPIEVFYYVLKGSAIVLDLHGKQYKVAEGDSLYAPAGLAGSHEWKIGPNGLELLSIRATKDGHRRMQFTVNRDSGESVIDMHELGRMDALEFESHY